MLGLRKSKSEKLEEKRIKDGNRFNDFCSNCGHALEEGAFFCGECGNKIQ